MLLIITTASFVNAQKKSQRVVVIDAGHGGKDPGTLGKSTREKTITLKIAQKVGNYLSSNTPEIKVIYTRSSDVFVSLERRAEIANRHHADLFVSIHGNSSASRSVYGTEVYHFPQAYTLNEDLTDLMEDSLAKKENKVVKTEKNYRERYFQLYKMTRAKSTKDYEQSVRLAKIMDNELNHRAGRRSRGVRSAKYLVIGMTEMPAVLIEVGYLSNLKEEKFLSSEEGQSLIASGIYRGIKTYFYGKKEPVLLADTPPPSMSAPKPGTKSTSEAKTEPQNKGGTPSAPKPAATKTEPLGEYKVQLGIFSKKVPTTEAKWKSVKSLKIEQNNGKYYYFDSGYSTKEAAEKQKNILRKNGFPDAFVPSKS